MPTDFMASPDGRDWWKITLHGGGKLGYCSNRRPSTTETLDSVSGFTVAPNSFSVAADPVTLAELDAWLENRSDVE